MQVQKSILVIVLSVACLFSYFNTLSANFVWDDFFLIVDAQYMHSFKYLPRFFTQDIWSVLMPESVSGYYRPMLAASFMLDYSLWGEKPFGYHLTNLIFHALASILVFLVIEMLLKEKITAFFSALLFSVHPLHTEAVSFISGRVDVMPFMFMLLSLLFFLKYSANKKRYFYSIAIFSYFVSLLFKEMGVTFPLIILLVDYLFISQRNARSVVRNLPRFHSGFFIALALYMLMRYYFIGWSFFVSKVHYASSFIFGTSLYWRVFTVSKIFTMYLKLLFLPVGLKTDYYFHPANSLFQPQVFIGFAVISALIFLAFANIKKHPIISFAIVWFFITFIPASNIFPIGNLFAERYMYIPSLGFCVGGGFFASWLAQRDVKLRYLNWKQSIFLIFCLLAFAWGRQTFERNKVWNNEFTLWYDTTKAAPNSLRAHLNLARAYITLNLLDEAMGQLRIIQFDHALYYEALGTLGEIYMKKGQVDRAIEAYKIAIEKAPGRAVAYSSLAAAYNKIERYSEAIEAESKALSINPYLGQTRIDLALNYSRLGRIDDAIKAYGDCLRYIPDSLDAHVSLGHLFYKSGDYRKAKEHWLAALKISKGYLPATEALRLLDKS